MIGLAQRYLIGYMVVMHLNLYLEIEIPIQMRVFIQPPYHWHW